MNRHGLIDEADLVRELNARRVKRGDAAADIVMAIILGIAGAVVLAHWLAS